MIVSIMQPYFFPYIGYFQLIAQSDVFVFHDDVQYIKGGWINRNRILDRKGCDTWVTLPIAAASHRLAIRERTYLSGKENARHIQHILRKIENAYRLAPNFSKVFPLLREMLAFGDTNVAGFNINLLESIAGYLGLRARFTRSSELPKTEGLTGQARVIDICSHLGATRYVNPVGGSDLYEAKAFARRGISLLFFETAIDPRQGKFPYLSIIHTLMNESDAAIHDRLRRYRIVLAPSEN
jgi:hypothetical protein